MSDASSTIQAVAAGIAIFSACSVVLLWVARRSIGGFKRFGRFLDDFEGEPARPGVPRRLGVMERLEGQDNVLAQLTASVADIQAELPKNGVPLATKIDALWARHLKDIANERAGT
jgi:hypothetical protein